MYIDQNLQKALSDRIYEKRKPAALQLEQNVRKALEQGNTELVTGIITELSRDFAYALRHPNYRNGGLIGLAAVAIALGGEALPAYLEDIIQPILACFGDADSRVRYYACESLYNVAKIAKGEILVFFNEIFDALCKLSADLEESVRNGANLVDQLLRDIVVESSFSSIFRIQKDAPQHVGAIVDPDGQEGLSYQRADTTEDFAKTTFTLDRFIPLLVERIYVINPATRMFLVQWIMLLDSIPDLELIRYVPDFLEGLLLFLTDSNKEVRVYTKTCLDTILKEICEVSELKKQSEPTTSVDDSKTPKAEKGGVNAGLYHIGQDTFIYYSQIVDILLGKMDPSQNEIRLVVLDWMEGLLQVCPGDVFSKLSNLVSTLLPALADEVADIRKAGKTLSDHLLDLVSAHAGSIDTTATFQALARQLDNEDKVLRLVILDWFRVLYQHSSNIFLKSSGSSVPDDLLSQLLSPLSDPSDEVVSQDLELLALILKNSSDNEFEKFAVKLSSLFRNNVQLFQTRSKFVLLQLCLLLTPERVFKTFAGILNYALRDTEKSDGDFDCTMIQNFSFILLTAPELNDFRTKLTKLHTADGVALFTTLFSSWKKNSVAVLTLCLLAKAYEPSFHVLQILAKHDVSVYTLIQIDKLVQLTEGPVLASLRMDLLEPQKNHFLYKTLYGLLMVLPQSPAFTMLNKRLESISSLFQLPPPSKQMDYGWLYDNNAAHSTKSASSGELNLPGVNWKALISEFMKYQTRSSKSPKIGSLNI